MTIESVKTMRGLERALGVLRHLQRHRSASLHELHQSTRLPKATLSRILLTLQREGFAAQRIADNRWSLGMELRARKQRASSSDVLSQIAAPILDELCARIIWPSDLSVRVGTHMELRETSRAHSSLLLGRLRVGFPINMLLSAPGRAYLAYSTAAHRSEMLTRMLRRPGAGDELASDRRFVDKAIRETQAQGFGSRDPSWGGHLTKPKRDYDDGLSAIAVPIMKGSVVLGCINIVWIRDLIDQKTMVQRHLNDLRTCADTIAEGYQRVAST